MVGDEMEGRIDGDGDRPRKPAADPAGDDHRADHAPSGGENQERTNRRRQVTADNHASVSHERTHRQQTSWRGARMPEEIGSMMLGVAHHVIAFPCCTQRCSGLDRGRQVIRAAES